MSKSIYSFFRKAPILLLITAAIFFTSFSCQQSQETISTTESITPPVAKKIPHELTAHGHTRIDNYYWLNQRDNPEVIAYLEAENAYKEAVMAHTEELQETLYQEIVSRIKKTDMSVPYLDNGYYYYTRFVEGGEYPIYCHKKGSLEAPEDILLDVNEMAEGFDYYHVTGLSVSPDNNVLAYGVDTVSRRKYTIYFKDLTSGELLPDQIPVTSGSAVWANDNKTVFYVVKDETTLRPFRVMRHVLGSDISEDEEVYVENDETFDTYVFKTKSKKYIMAASVQTLSTEFRFLEADNPDGEFKLIQSRERNLEYRVDHYGDNFYVLTNLEAKNFRLMETPVTRPSKENWQEIIPHRKDVLLEGMELFTDFLVLEERRNGLR
ncbi:MAG: oligopeptidase B, partial [Acidobacteriota bacterium]